MPGAAVFFWAQESGRDRKVSPFFLAAKTNQAALGGLFFVMVMAGMAMMLGVVNARLVRMLVRMQLVAMRDMRMVRRLFMVAGFVMVGRFVVVLGGLFMMLGGLAMMFSAFVTCRHIHVLHEVITL